MEKVRLGIIGAGRLGGFHASKAAANPEVELVGVADVCEANRRRVASMFNACECESIPDLLSRVDAVVVAAPSVLHATIGQEVLRAGKHLLMEKPLATDGEAALKLADMAKKRGLVMQVGHVEQHNPAWRAATSCLEDVRSGAEPAIIDAVRASGYTFRCTDVGATLDLMIHDLELTLSLIPSPIERVYAFGVTQLGGFEDAAYATLLFANGSVARLKASRIEQTPRRFMTIQAASKTVQIDFAAREAKVTQPKREVLDGRFSPSSVTLAEMGSRASTFMKDEYETVNLAHEPVDALALEMQNFVSAILRGERSVAPGDRAAQAVVVAEEIARDLEARARKSGARRAKPLRIAG